MAATLSHLDSTSGSLYPSGALFVLAITTGLLAVLALQERWSRCALF
jgi:hypothetical protein